MNLLRKYVNMFRQDMKIEMSSRCGLDELNNFIMLIGFVFVLISLFTQKPIFTLLGLAFVFLCYARVFSKQVYKRQKENNLYMKYMGRIVLFVRYIKLVLKMQIKSLFDKEYKYFVCKQCKQMIRVPKGKNKVNIKCPKCGNTFIKRT